jgi:hypothetical protein
MKPYEFTTKDGKRYRVLGIGKPNIGDSYVPRDTAVWWLSWGKARVRLADKPMRDSSYDAIIVEPVEE